MVNKLFDFIQSSPTAFHAIESASKILDEAGFCRLKDNQPWSLKPNSSYYVIRHGSALIAFKTGEVFSYNLVAAHTDSPTFRIKTAPLMKTGDNKLNVEVYGGPIYNTWLDRPLGIAGRVVVEKEGKLTVKNVILDKTVVIPNLAIHLNRSVNEGIKINPQVDMCPVLGEGENFERLFTKEGEKLLDYDLMLFCKDQGYQWGDGEKYISCPRLDDLEGCFCALQGLLECSNRSISVLALLDSEEVGSATYTGANSQFLHDTVIRIGEGLNKTRSEVINAIQDSILVSLDNAHGVHPNHPELYDPTNRCKLNGGIVIKHHCSSYTSNAVSSAIIKKIFTNAGVACQDFYNRSDLRGGSTLGALSISQLSVNSVDIGLAQWAMHSACESAGVKDVEYLVKGICEFYSSVITKNDDEISISNIKEN